MNSLSIRFFLPIEKSVLVLWLHLILSRHLRLPSLQHFRSGILFRECSVNGGYDGIDCAKAFPLAGFLWAGQTPGDFPVGQRVRLAVVTGISCGK